MSWSLNAKWHSGNGVSKTINAQLEQSIRQLHKILQDPRLIGDEKFHKRVKYRINVKSK